MDSSRWEQWRVIDSLVILWTCTELSEVDVRQCRLSFKAFNDELMSLNGSLLSVTRNWAKFRDIRLKFTVKSFVQSLRNTQTWTLQSVWKLWKKSSPKVFKTLHWALRLCSMYFSSCTTNAPVRLWKGTKTFRSSSRKVCENFWHFPGPACLYRIFLSHL